MALNSAGDDLMQSLPIQARRDESELRVETVDVSFGGVRAVQGVDLVLRKGEILGLIGPNGAGKTSLVNAITGFVRPDKGRVMLSGVNITGRSPARIARLGVARTFQGCRLFRELTVLENVEVGGVGIGLSRREAKQRAWDILTDMSISALASVRAGSLSYGDEQRIGLARAVAAKPTFLLVDEPAAGLSEAETDELTETIVRIRDTYSCGVLVIEHDMRLIMQLCERIQVLDQGKTIGSGTRDEVQNDPVVIQAYLGVSTGPGV